MKKKTLRVMLEQERITKDMLLEAKAELETRVEELERALCKLSAEHRDPCPADGALGPHACVLYFYPFQRGSIRVD